MKHLILAVIAVASLVHAQISIPICAQNCVAYAVRSSTTCASIDTTCQCLPVNRSAIESTATRCVLSVCGSDAVSIVLSLVDASCRALPSVSSTSIAQHTSSVVVVKQLLRPASYPIPNAIANTLSSGQIISFMALDKIIGRQTRLCTPVSTQSCSLSCGVGYVTCVAWPTCYSPERGDTCCSDGTYCSSGTYCTNQGCCPNGSSLAACGATSSLGVIAPPAPGSTSSAVSSPTTASTTSTTSSNLQSSSTSSSTTSTPLKGLDFPANTLPPSTSSTTSSSSSTSTTPNPNPSTNSQPSVSISTASKGVKAGIAIGAIAAVAIIGLLLWIVLLLRKRHKMHDMDRRAEEKRRGGYNHNGEISEIGGAAGGTELPVIEKRREELDGVGKARGEEVELPG